MGQIQPVLFSLACALAILGGKTAFSATTTLVPKSYATSAGSTGGQPVASSICILDSSGTTNTWAKYVEFKPGSSNYAGTQLFSLPTSIAPSSVMGLQVQVNYQGPATSTQTWTWSIYDWNSAAYVKVGTNAGVSDWGAWKLLTFNVSGTWANYIRATDGAIKLRLASNNAADSVDIDYESVVVTHGDVPSIRVSVAPQTTTLQSGQSQTFTAAVTGTSNTAVTWSCTGGIISASGAYTAPAATGTYSVTATSAADTTVRGSATVNVVSSPTISVSVSPANVTLQPGQLQAFMAAVTGTSNTAVTWSCTGGTISASGAYTAPAAPGTYTVTATSAADVSRTASSIITVTDPPSGKSYYVASNGSDSNPGTLAAPWRTLQHAADTVNAGSTVYVRGGTYSEKVRINVSGSDSGGFITFQSQPGETAVLDGSSLTVPAGGEDALFTVEGRSYVKIQGFELCHLSSLGTGVPMGILVRGGCEHVELRNNLIHDIACPETSTKHNAHGIACYGNNAKAMTNLVISGNEIWNCKLGQSETLTVNGNVDGFEISYNTIHDTDNIGIDCIGYEEVGPSGYDYARNGRVFRNKVYNIDDSTNGAYGSKDRGGADGIYVDGGASIVIEGNQVDACPIGIETASEHQDQVTRDIIVRNNFVSRSKGPNLCAGGSGETNGGALNITFVNNTTYQGGEGELKLQNNCSNILIKNNIFLGSTYLYQDGAGNTGITASNNLYWGGSTTSSGTWRDASGKFINPLLVDGYRDLHLSANSPAIDAGVDAGKDSKGAPLSGTEDVDGQARVQGTIDLGADEAR